MNTRIIEYLSSDHILLVKLKNVPFQYADLKLYRLQFWTFSNVILHLECTGNVYSIKIWWHLFLFVHPPWSNVHWHVQLRKSSAAFCLISTFLMPSINYKSFTFQSDNFLKIWGLDQEWHQHPRVTMCFWHTIHQSTPWKSKGLSTNGPNFHMICQYPVVGMFKL